MKLTLNINHRNVSISINASVGKGVGTIKWLSLMAAQKYALQLPNGRLRHKERNSYIGSMKKPELLPQNVYTDEIPFLHPHCIIHKRLQDGQVVHIDLYDTIPLDEFSIPQYSPFAYIAFFVSDSKAEVREKLTQEKLQEAKEFDEMRVREAEEERVSSNRPKLQKMRSILMEQLGDQDIITTSMANEWSYIVNSGILDSLVPSTQEQLEIKNFFTQNYEEMSHMYKYYSAVNSGGGTHTLEYIEFTKFLQETDIFKSLQSNVIIKLFGASPSNIHSEIIQWEFFVSCIKIAIYKYITLAKKIMAALKKRGHRADITQASTPTPFQAVEMLYSNYLQPVIDRLPASTAVKKALDSEEVLLLIHEHLDELTRAFCHYGEETTSSSLENPTIDDMDGIRGSVMMNLQQFITFSTEFDYFGPIHPIPMESRSDRSTNTSTTGNCNNVIMDNDISISDASNSSISNNNNSKVTNSNFVKDEITLKDVRQIFSASQHDTTMNDVETQLIKDDSHKETMVFAEYIEAIVRLGFLKYPSSPSSCSTSSSLGGNVEHENVHEHHQNHHFESIRLAIEKVTCKKKN